jgi:hypothetical protein
MPQHKPKHVTCACSERDADSDFIRPLTDVVRDDAVEADRPPEKVLAAY